MYKQVKDIVILLKHFELRVEGYAKTIGESFDLIILLKH